MASARDFLDDAGILGGLRDFCVSKGSSQVAVDGMIDRLRFFGGSGGTTPVQEVEEPSGDEPPTPATLPATLPGTPVVPAASDSGSEEEALEGYLVSRTSKRGVRCLHHLGLCWRVPGVDIKDFDLFGAACPPSDRYDRVCRDCWPEGLSRPEASEGSVRSSDEDAESSGSEGQAAASSEG